MHIYTHNAIHIYCLYIYIYILHTDTNFVLYSWPQMHFNALKKKKEIKNIFQLFSLEIISWFQFDGFL